MTAPRPLRIVLFVIACAVVAVLSLTPVEELPKTGVSDKIEHFIAYAGLALLGAWAFPHPLLRLAAGLVAFGVGVEILQATMGLGRQGDIVDALANTLGVMAGLGFVRSRR
jgi:VanZ family protein